MPANDPLDDLMKQRKAALKGYLGGLPPDEFRDLWDTHPGLAMGLSMDSIRFGEGMILQCRLGLLEAASDAQLAVLEHADLLPFLFSSEAGIRQAGLRAAGKVSKGSPQS